MAKCSTINRVSTGGTGVLLVFFWCCATEGKTQKNTRRETAAMSVTAVRQTEMNCCQVDVGCRIDWFGWCRWAKS